MVSLATLTGNAGAATLPTPVTLPSEQDHGRPMQLLHITELRRGPDGDPTSPHAANFDESKVAPYSLPDPLMMKSGTRVPSGAQWWKLRRPEIVEELDREIYGRVPPNLPNVIWGVTRVTPETIGSVPVLTKELSGHVDNAAYPFIEVNIQLTLTVPAAASGPVPLMMEFGLSPETLAMLRKRFSDEQWATFMGTGLSWQSQVLTKGWGYAVLIPTSIQSDSGDGLTQGIIGLANNGQPRKLDDWGALRAWAWGA